ncbi:MAG TPA: beta-N-acetylglucosaminidase domain-containing protein [Pseudonocardiaceae bacterium]|nr:beta-N-acetylglucosaminidase domain-containing protein [Pseudonocardiaceae bacterium]
MPQSMAAFSTGFVLPGSAALVVGSGTDASAITEVEAVLSAAGVSSVTVGSTPAGPGGLTVYVGGPSESAASATALSGFGVSGPDGFASGGYVLVVGQQDGNDEAVLSGVDPTGTFYAAQTLRQLVQPGANGGFQLPGVQVRDSPGFPIRGGEESFYGNPWSQADLLHHLDFLGQHKMNTFQYTAAGDPHTVGAQWRSTYPADQLANFQQAIARAQTNHVDFIYRIDPEAPVAVTSGICHSDPTDLADLVARYQQLWDVGERTFDVGWDDTNGGFVCAQDQQMFGGDASPKAAAQAYVVNYVYNNFIATHAGAKLLTIPGEYAGDQSSTYRTRFGQLIPGAVTMFWTGPQVISPTITAADLSSAQQAFGRQLLIFDNYPVNDYVTNQEHLGPLVGRDPNLGDNALGLISNEMLEAEPSLIPLFTIADYTWNPKAYNAEDSWTRSLQEFAGSSPSVYPALRAYAENSVASPLTTDVSPVLAPLVSTFEQAYASHGDLTDPGNALLSELRTIEQSPGVLRASLPDQAFLTESDPYLTSLQQRATAAEDAVKALIAENAGDEATTWQDRQQMGQAMAAAHATGKLVAPGVYEQLVQLATGARSSTVVQAHSGAMEAFDRGADGQLDTAWQTSPGSTWQPFFALAGVSMQGRPDAIVSRVGTMSAYVRGANNQLWTNWQSSVGSPWQPGWTSLGGSLGGDPKVVATDSGALAVFVRGSDGQLDVTHQYSEGSNWTPLAALPGITMLGDPDAIVTYSGVMSVYVRGSDNQLWTNWQTGPGVDAPWHGWAPLGGSIAGDPKVVLTDNGALTIVARGTDGQVYTTSQSSEGSSWSAPAPIASPGLTAQGDVDAAIDFDGSISVYMRANDNNIWTNWQPGEGATSWHGWVIPSGRSFAGDPHVVANVDNDALALFAIGGNANLYTSWQSGPGSGWSGWADLGGNLTN